MSALAWLIIPAVAGALATLWVIWSSRTRSTGDNDSLAGHQRFRDAMERGTTRPPEP